MFALRACLVIVLLASHVFARHADPCSIPKCVCDPACSCGCQDGGLCECCCDDPLCGWWMLWEKGEHAGFVHVLTPTKGAYLITWLYSPRIEGDSITMRPTTHGKGSRHKHSLAVAWPDEKGFGVAAYEIVSDRCVQGRAETWHKAKLPASVRAYRPASLCAVRRELPQRIDDPQALIDALHALRAGYLDWLAAAYDPYPMLPSREACERNAAIADQWRDACAKDAHTLGYMTRLSDPEIWDPQAERWTSGGGWHAISLRDERDEADTLYQVWTYTAILRGGEEWIRLGGYWSGVDRLTARDRLIDIIGEANLAVGRLPPPVPVWRVPRE